MRAVQLTAFGNPVDGVKYVDIPEPDAPGPNQVLIGVEFSPIDPSDLLLALGIYALHPALPTIIGNEAVGRVLAVGPGVESVKVWRPWLWRRFPQLRLERAGWLFRRTSSFALLPDADPQQLAMLAINPPTAALLLKRKYGHPEAGRVGGAERRQFRCRAAGDLRSAAVRGLKTVNIVRRPELVAELEAIGGDVVVVDSPDVPERIKAAVGQAELRLALDGISGPATGVLAATLSPRGTLVSFAAMSLSPMSISPLDVIFKPLTMRGFYMGHPEFATKLAPAAAQAAKMLASGRLHIPVAATYPPLVHQGSHRACATRRKDSSGRSRIIPLTPE